MVWDLFAVVKHQGQLNTGHCEYISSIPGFGGVEGRTRKGRRGTNKSLIFALASSNADTNFAKFKDEWYFFGELSRSVHAVTSSSTDFLFTSLDLLLLPRRRESRTFVPRNRPQLQTVRSPSTLRGRVLDELIH